MKNFVRVLVILCFIAVSSGAAQAYFDIDFSTATAYWSGSASIVTDQVYNNYYGCIAVEWEYDGDYIAFVPVSAWYSSGCDGGFVGGCYNDPVYGYICVN